MEDYFNEYIPSSLLTSNKINKNYKDEFEKNLNIAKQAINDNKNIIICGPGCSGKSYLKQQLSDLLKEYDIYYGIDSYHCRNKSNGRHYSYNKFWIEEINENLISNVIEDYEFIRTTLVYNR